MKRCKRCCMPDTRPDTAFVDGVCSACLSYDKQVLIDWDERKEELIKLLDRHDGQCIVPSSGGKDSHYQVLSLLELGADVTVVTASTCMLTEIGRKNIDNLARYARTVEVTPNRTVRAKLNRLGLKLVGDISWPEHISIFNVPFRMACALNIPLIFYGENPQAQYGGPLGADEAHEMTRRWVSEFGGFLGLRPQDLIGKEGLTSRDMWDYLPPPLLDTEITGVEAHFLGQYLGPWDSRRNAEIAAKAGMIQQLPSPANYWAHENLDSAFTGIHDYFGYLKYGYGRATAQLSVDIRAGRASRDNALILAKALDRQFPETYMGIPIETILDHIGITRNEFDQIAARFTNQDIHGHAIGQTHHSRAFETRRPARKG